jgi:hypothetical protein
MLNIQHFMITTYHSYFDKMAINNRIWYFNQDQIAFSKIFRFRFLAAPKRRRKEHEKITILKKLTSSSVRISQKKVCLYLFG